MKNILFIVLFSTMLFSCKNSQEKDLELDGTEIDSTASLKTYQGEFLYNADAAVFKGNSFVYGVTIDAMAEELAAQTAKVKIEDYDMVPVVVRGVVSRKPAGQEGWDEILTITEILKVSDKPSAADIKLEEKKS